MPSAVPHKRITAVLPFFSFDAKKVTKSPDKIAVKKAAIFIGETVLKIIQLAPKDCAITAPSVAPEDMPMIPGSARGFLKYI